MKKFLAVSAALLIAFVALGCSNVMTAQPTGFDAYMKNCVVQGDDGYVVEGDMKVDTLDQVRALYQEYITGNDSGKGTVNIVNGAYDIWTPAKATNITYCISNLFSTKKQTVINWMATANQKWSATGKVAFVYVPAQDGNATSSNNNVVFNIRPATSKEERTYGRQGVLAWTFFPSYSRAKREFVIFKAAWNYDYNYLFLHELGHTVGLRHEHIWDHLTSESTTGAQLITSYVDYKSIMFYNYLDGYTGNNDISAGDKYTMTFLYGAP